MATATKEKTKAKTKKSSTSKVVLNDLSDINFSHSYNEADKLRIAELIDSMDGDIRFLQGNLWNITTHGEKKSITELYNWNDKTIKTYANIAKSFPADVLKKHKNIKWTHLVKILSAEKDARLKWVRVANDNKFTIAQLVEEIAQENDTTGHTTGNSKRQTEEEKKTEQEKTEKAEQAKKDKEKKEETKRAKQAKERAQAKEQTKQNEEFKRQKDFKDMHQDTYGEACQTLGLPTLEWIAESTFKIIKRGLQTLHHPDKKGGSVERSALINDACDILSGKAKDGKTGRKIASIIRVGI